MRNRVLSFVLSIAILLNLLGCQKNSEKKIEVNQIKGDYLTVDDEITEEINMMFYLNKLNKIAPTYNYEEFYYSNDDIKEIINIVKSKKECLRKEEKIWEDLYKEIRVINNNEEEEIINIKEALKKVLKNIYAEDLVDYEDFCRLRDLTIVTDELQDAEKNQVILGKYLVEDNKIIIYYDNCYQDYLLNYKDEKSFIEYLTHVLTHEINHARQNACDCRLKKGQKNKTIEIRKDNFNFGQFLIEASSESHIYSEDIREDYQLYTSQDFYYYEERISQNYLLLLGLVKKEFVLERYYEAIFNNDLASLFQIYNLDSEREIKDFYNIIYNLETINNRTNLSAYLQDLGCYYLGAVEEKVGSTYKIYIFREVIKDIIKSINEGNLLLEESIYLYDYVKFMVVNGKGIYQISKDYYDEDYSQMINEIEGIFNTYLCNYYNVKRDNIYCVREDSEYYENLRGLLDYKELMNSDKEIINSLVKKYPTIIEISFTFKENLDLLEPYLKLTRSR